MGPKTQADEIQILRTALERIKVIGADHAKHNTIAGACGAIAICALIEADGIEFERDHDQQKYWLTERHPGEDVPWFETDDRAL